MADDLKQLAFTMEDFLGGKPLSPSNVDLPTLRGFLEEVETLIKGDAANASLADSRVELKDGFLKVLAMVTAVLASNVQFEMGKLATTGDLDQIQNNRAKIILRWQGRVQKSPTRRYSILPMDASRQVLIVPSSRFQHQSENAWVEVEKYLTGTVENAGGKQDPNIHLSMPNSGVTLKVSASKEQLREQRENQLYKNVTLLVRAEQNMLSKSLRNIVLLSFINPPDALDKEALQTLWREGREAWKDVPSATLWVEEIRGNQERI